MIREAESEPSREELIALIAALRTENTSLKARIAELERRLGLNSSNSGKPPSSDGLKKPVRVKSLREGSGKQQGGQKGHKGETLRQVTDPDDVVDHYPSACSMCGAGLGPDASVGHSARQVFDLPKPQPLIVTEHRAHDCQCAACGARTRAPFPDGVNAPVQYGVGIAAFVIREQQNLCFFATIYALNVSNVPGVTITGTSAANTIDATHTVAGQPLPTNEEDTINAGGGNDTINALGGNDFINGGAGADTMFGGTGNDTYVVDNGGDIVNETGGNGLDTVQSSITFSLSDAVHAIGVIEDLTLTGTAAINGTGNALTNVITGNSGNNVIAGLGGADILDGGGGTDTATYATSPAGVNVSLATGHGSGGHAQGDTLINIETLTGSSFEDMLEGNGGNNFLAGGLGADTVSYEHAAAGVTVSLSIAAAQNTLGAGTDTLSGFENLTGSDFNDKLTGSSLANVLMGGAGNDVINGGAGNDTLQGDAQDDVLIGDAGADALDGGDGNDTASYATATAGVTVSLVLQGGTQNTVGAGVDTLTGIENLIGSAFNDRLTGDAGNNVLTGGAGNDTFVGGLGDDTLDGGAGTGDTATYAASALGVNVSLMTGLGSGGDAEGDTLVNIENLTGSNFDDVLEGNGGNNVLAGGANGVAGDTISYEHATAGVTVNLATASAQNTVGAGTDTLSGFENIIGSAFNDTLTGTAGANVLIGGAGNDKLTGGTGADAFVFSLATDGLDTITDFV